MTDKPTDDFPVKYVLYSHYANREDDDFNDWKGENGTPIAVENLKGVGLLISRLKALQNLLFEPKQEGMAVLFYAPGLTEFFDGIAEGKTKEELLKECPKLYFAKMVDDYIARALGSDPVRRRIRFVTALDLYTIFARVKSVEADNLRWWFIGQSEQIHYDTPKIVEAFVRLRLLGNGVPVFRVDWDVLFSSEEKTVSDLGLSIAVDTCIKAYQFRLKDPSIATFLFSASYDCSNLEEPDPMKRFDRWRGAFATRVFPALIIDDGLIADVRKGGLTWEQYANRVFQKQPAVKLAKRFYGVEFEKDNGLVCDNLEDEDGDGLALFGAHPLFSVISGAFLCQSDGAILDLPPFSNFSRNVVWIDDHLKYSLHRELRHLISADLEFEEPGLNDARIDKRKLTKARGDIKDLPDYILNKYLPALLWGTVLDAWINPNSLIKCRPKALSEDQRTRLRNITPKEGSAAALPNALQKAAETGKFPFGDRYRLRKELIRDGLARINKVRKLWARLTEGGHHTFASIWAEGPPDRIRAIFPDLEGRALGISHRPLPTEIKEPSQLAPELREDFDQVVEDTLQYVEWTMHWPGIVRIVRSIAQGKIRTDMSWLPPKEQ